MISVVAGIGGLYSYGGMLARVITFTASQRSMALKLFELLGVDDLGYGDPIEWERQA